MRISDWSSDVCSSDLHLRHASDRFGAGVFRAIIVRHEACDRFLEGVLEDLLQCRAVARRLGSERRIGAPVADPVDMLLRQIPLAQCPEGIARRFCNRLAPVTQIFGASLLCRLDDQRQEHTSELQSLMRISYAVFCLKKKKTRNKRRTN